MMIADTVGQYYLDGRAILIKVIKESHPEIQLVYRLWYDVYIHELNHPVKNGINHDAKTFVSKKPGSYILIAFCDGECIGTMRSASSEESNLEFDYGHFQDGKKLAEVDKLVIREDFRRGDLSSLMMMHMQFFCRKTFEYDAIVIATATPMIPLLRYYKSIGFEKVFDHVIIHPTYKFESYLMFCHFRKFNIIAERIYSKVAIKRQLSLHKVIKKQTVPDALKKRTHLGR